MPISATWGGQRIESWRMPDADWLEMKSTYRSLGLLLSCGQGGVPVQRHGTRFFRHKPKTECGLHESGPETIEHVRMKALVADVSAELGWTATVEAPAADRSWIADVLLEQEGRRPIAVEVQWSSQTDTVFQERSRRYERDGVICQWLAGPKNHHSSAGVRAVPIDGDADDMGMLLPGNVGSELQRMPAADGLRLLLGGRVREHFEADVDAVGVSVGMTKCWRESCGRWVSVWYVTAVRMRTMCGQVCSVSIASRYPTLTTDRAETWMEEPVRAAIARSGLPVATEYRAFSSRTAKQWYLAQHCPHCNTPFGDIPLWSDRRIRWEEYEIPVGALRIPLHPKTTAARHVCASRDGGAACNPVPPRGTTYPLERIPSGDWLSFNSQRVWAGGLGLDPLPAKGSRR